MDEAEVVQPKVDLTSILQRARAEQGIDKLLDKQRLNFITILGGKKFDIRLTWQLWCEQVIRLAIRNRVEMDWEGELMVFAKFIVEYSPSLQGKRAQDIVDILRQAAPEAVKLSLVDKAKKRLGQ